MVQLHDCTATDVFLLLATILVYVGAQATTGALGNAAKYSLPAPSTCAFTSVNHVTQTLPQQCFTTTWQENAKEQAIAAESPETGKDQSSFADAYTPRTITATASATSSQTTVHSGSDHPHQQPSETHSPSTASTSSTERAEPTSKDVGEDSSDGDSESPLDNAHFLSFEEWKSRNLAEAGQSADNFGGGRSGAAEPRRRPGGINNALDSLGEDTEIEIDFGGFVNPPIPGVQPAGQNNPRESGGPAGNLADEKPRAQVTKAHSRSKDAGVTCKERSNYASFDCASTVLKTNPEGKSSTSVLVENKDSYMLNICSANNKFFIVELCDDILVDTVVLANYEFFSSIFRTFRVSVSDRYPVRLDKWRELGTFEAQNSRGIQAFLIEEPQIWARYLRIEFLTHYGHEYYCPVSLLRIHGTTMMEEFNHELKNSKGEEEADDDEESPSIHDVVTADVLIQESKTNAEQSALTEAPATDRSILPATKQNTDDREERSDSTLKPVESLANTMLWNNSALAQAATIFASESSRVQTCRRDDALTESSRPSPAQTVSDAANIVKSASPSSAAGILIQSAPLPSATSTDGHSSSSASLPPATPDITHSTANQNASISSRATTSSSLQPSKSHVSSSSPPSKSHTTSTHPSPPNPTTQESFFKSVHKRLQLLESNSTLSLQYIEDQSRILRDAFAKVEKRQLTKTSIFLELLNSTVLNEVREFRTQYDQIWQSTVLELSSQRQQSQVEIAALSTRLTLLADELLFQKRIAILQFSLILLCLGLALFSRGSFAGGDYLEHVVNKSSINLSRYASQLDSPPDGSPPSTRPPSRYGFFSRAASSFSHRRSPSEDSMIGEVERERARAKSPSIAYSPPTPTSLSAGSEAGDCSPGRTGASSERDGESPDRGGDAPGMDGKKRMRNGVSGSEEHRETNGLLSPDDRGSSVDSGGATLVHNMEVATS